MASLARVRLPRSLVRIPPAITHAVPKKSEQLGLIPFCLFYCWTAPPIRRSCHPNHGGHDPVAHPRGARQAVPSETTRRLVPILPMRETRLGGGGVQGPAPEHVQANADDAAYGNGRRCTVQGQVDSRVLSFGYRAGTGSSVACFGARLMLGCVCRKLFPSVWSMALLPKTASSPHIGVIPLP